MDKDPNIPTTVYHKEGDHKNYLHIKSEHPLCLKKNISFSKALRIKQICFIKTEFEDECAELIQKLVDWGYKES